MSPTSQALRTNPIIHRFTCVHTQTFTKHSLNTKFYVHPHLLKNSSPLFNRYSSKSQFVPLKSFNSCTPSPIGAKCHRSSSFTFDNFLLLSELLCLISSAVCPVGFLMSCVVMGMEKASEVWLGSRLLLWQVAALVIGVWIGAWIRRRQWRRTCGMEGKERDYGEANLVERIEKLEENVHSSSTIVRALSRQLEKLGIRFRVTRKALKAPIAETAGLVQKNSEMSRTLAMQVNILEKELGELQKVLMAMQEQQRKQLELILAIGKNWKVCEDGGSVDQ